MRRTVEKNLCYPILQYIDVPESIQDVIELSDYAVQMRYPGEYYPVSEVEYERALELAERVLRWARLQVQTYGEG